MTGSISDFVNRILNEYKYEKNKKHAKNSLDEFIRLKAPEDFYETNIISENEYLVKGSTGNGRWATTPWLAIFDRTVTTTAQKEVYIIYLLSSDCKSLYLTLNQGCTELSGGKRFVEEAAIKIMKEKASDVVAEIDNRGFEIGEIDLGGGLSVLGKYYEKGSIFYKKYEFGAVPSEEKLQEDLSKMVEIYKEYVDKNPAVQPESEKAVKIMNEKIDKNMILYGPPGTGKTYRTAKYAVAICDKMSLEKVDEWEYKNVLKRYNELKKEKRVVFTTFHQSYGYEEFIEGIKPELDDDNNVIYKVESGLFKKFCKTAGKAHVDIGTSNTNGHKATGNERLWCVLLGEKEDENLKGQCYDNNEIRIGWPESPKFINQDTEGLGSNNRRSLLYFQDDMKKGDYVVVRSSSTEIDGFGLITGDYEYDNSNREYPRKRKVKWIHKGSPIDIFELNGNTNMDRKTVYALDRVDVNKLAQLVPGANVTVEERPHVFVIDEINRGNISKIFGELITLIESTKRNGAEEAMEVVLPYSGDLFSVPNNIYILGTMNTANRSIALMDTALRRRFGFVEMMPDVSLLDGVNIVDNSVSVNIGQMLRVINERITFLYDREHTIGHAFFMKLVQGSTVSVLAEIFKKSVVPLLQEYFYEDYEKIRLVLGDSAKKDKDAQFIQVYDIPDDLFDIDVSETIDISEEKNYTIAYKNFNNIMAYKGISKRL